jgi:hypothetical protein
MFIVIIPSDRNRLERDFRKTGISALHDRRGTALKLQTCLLLLTMGQVDAAVKWDMRGSR